MYKKVVSVSYSAFDENKFARMATSEKVSIYAERVWLAIRVIKNA